MHHRPRNEAFDTGTRTGGSEKRLERKATKMAHIIVIKSDHIAGINGDKFTGLKGCCRKEAKAGGIGGSMQGGRADGKTAAFADNRSREEQYGTHLQIRWAVE